MRVIIDDGMKEHTYVVGENAKKILIILSEEDKKNIANMAEDAHGYCLFDKQSDPLLVDAWIKEKLTTDIELEKIWKQCLRNRLDPNKDYCKIGWHIEDHFSAGTMTRKAKELLKAGYKVKGGYFTTSVREFHNKVLLWKIDKDVVCECGHTAEVHNYAGCLCTLKDGQDCSCDKFKAKNNRFV